MLCLFIVHMVQYGVIRKLCGYLKKEKKRHVNAELYDRREERDKNVSCMWILIHISIIASEA